MPNNYGLFFQRDNLLIRLPVNPEKLPVSRDTKNDSYNVLGIGPIMVPRTPSLKVIKISSFFPGRVSSFVLTPNEFKEPEFYIQFFESAMKDKTPIIYAPARYYEDGQPFMTGDASFSVLVTQFDTEERGGETGDFYYNLELTEYRDYSPKSITLQSSGTNQPVQATTEATRSIPAGQIVVGSTCIANGRYYYTSYGDSPYGNGNGQRVVVSRIVDLSRTAPYLIQTETGGMLGWTSASALQVVSNT